MINPHKYLDLDTSTIMVGATVLTILKKEPILRYDELLVRIVETLGENAKESFLSTLSFLYLLGKIEYYKEIDSIGLIL